MCSQSVRERLLKILTRFSLPTQIHADAEKLIEFARHDKKKAGDSINLIFVSDAGSFEEKKLAFTEYEDMIREALK